MRVKEERVHSLRAFLLIFRTIEESQTRRGRLIAGDKIYVGNYGGIPIIDCLTSSRDNHESRANDPRYIPARCVPPCASVSRTEIRLCWENRIALGEPLTRARGRSLSRLNAFSVRLVPSAIAAMRKSAKTSDARACVCPLERDKNMPNVPKVC